MNARGKLVGGAANIESRSMDALDMPMSVAYSGCMVDWSQCAVVESDPQRVHGAWVFRNTRLPVSIVFECLAKGATIDEIIEWYGGVTQRKSNRSSISSLIASKNPYMRSLFDHNVPFPLRYSLGGHTVETTGERAWN
jgi:uncharacterized protein (DUF433 family)